VQFKPVVTMEIEANEWQQMDKMCRN